MRLTVPAAELSERIWTPAESLPPSCASCGVAQDACDTARRLLLDASESVRKALGVLPHGRDVIVHMPIGVVGATRAVE